MAAEIGFAFEEALEAAFKELNNDYLLQWHAFPDTKRTNGGAVSTQPSDYLLGLPPGSGPEQRMLFLEAKASEKYKTLQKAAVHAGQRGFIQRWGRMCQLPYHIAFYSAVTGQLQVWKGDAVVTTNRVNKKYLLFTSDSLGTGSVIDKNALASALASFYDLPDKLKTVKLYERLDD